jgi:serine/threonine protein kinase
VTQARRIGPFDLSDFLGEGHGTNLYRAVRPEGVRPPYEVCIRIAQNPVDAEIARAIRTEYETLRAMDNPRIPKAYGHYPDESAIAMSYYAGATLSDVLQAQSDGLIKLSISTAIDIVIEIAHGLRHAHSIVGPNGTRITHGHLGPQRVRITPNGDVVVVGFGSQTKGRHPAYTAPETADGTAISPASDQWTLGAMMVELILGERLYTGVANIDHATRDGDVGFWTSRVAEVHPELEPALRTMLATDPDARFRRGHELLKALLSAGRKIGGTVNRRNLATSVMTHGHRLSRVRPERNPLDISLPMTGEAAPAASAGPPPVRDLPSPSPHDFSAATPPLAASLPSEPRLHETDSYDSEVTVDIADTLEKAPPAPEPAPRYLPSEFAGAALGSLMLALGITYVFWVL